MTAVFQLSIYILKNNKLSWLLMTVMDLSFSHLVLSHHTLHKVHNLQSNLVIMS
jgi:hypothetical protein